MPSLLIAILRSSMELLTWRGAVFVTFALIRRGTTLRERAAWVLGFVSLFAGCAHREGFVSEFARLTMGLGYYVLLALLLFAGQREARRRGVTGAPLFAILMVVCLLLPALVCRRLSLLTILIFGWHFMLAAYSYCADAGKDAKAPVLVDCLFFLLLDPSLVYPLRARRLDRGRDVLGASRRFAMGAFLLVLGSGAIAALASKPGVLALDSYSRVMVSGIALFFAHYWVRAGVADIDIALVQWSGFRLRECFRRPYLAKSPADLWRRWNIYVGSWVRRYVFTPLARDLIAQYSGVLGGQLRIRVSGTLAIVVSFAIIGLLHDVFRWAAEGALEVRSAIMFVAGAVGMIVWDVARSMILRIFAGRESKLAPWGRVFVLHYIVLMVLLSGVAR